MQPSYPPRMRALDVETYESLFILLERVNQQIFALRTLGLFAEFDLSKDSEGMILGIEMPPKLYRNFKEEKNE